MEKRRIGSIDWRDGRWRIRLRFPDGKREAMYFPAPDEPRLTCTRDSAEGQAAKVEAEKMLAAALLLVRDTFDDPRLRLEPSLGAWGIRWLNDREVTHRDAGGDRQRWNAYIASSSLAQIRLKALTTLHCQRWLNVLAKETSSRTGEVRDRQTIKNALSTLRAALRGAIRAELLDWNPAAECELPPASVDQVLDEGEEITFLDVDEIERVLALPLTAAQRSAFVVGIFTGLRPSDMFRLRWADVRLSGPSPEVIARRAKNTKTKRIPLLPPAVMALRIWRVVQARSTDRLMRRRDGRVWPGASGGSHCRGYDWGWADSTHGLPGVRRRARVRDDVTWYSATRHTCGTHLLLGTWVAGKWVPRALRIEEVSTWLRHSSTAVTERHYARFTADGLHDLLRGSKPGSRGPGLAKLLSHLGDLNPRPTVYEGTRKLYAVEGLGEKADPVELGLKVLEAQSRGEPPAPAAITTAIEALIVALREASAWRVRAGGA